MIIYKPNASENQMTALYSYSAVNIYQILSQVMQWCFCFVMKDTLRTSSDIHRRIIYFFFLFNIVKKDLKSAFHLPYSETNPQKGATLCKHDHIL